MTVSVENTPANRIREKEFREIQREASLHLQVIDRAITPYDVMHARCRNLGGDEFHAEVRLTVVACVCLEERLHRDHSDSVAAGRVSSDCMTRMKPLGALEDHQLVALPDDYPRMTELGGAKEQWRHEVELEGVDESRARRLVEEDDVAGPELCAHIIEAQGRVLLVSQPSPLDPPVRRTALHDVTD